MGSIYFAGPLTEALDAFKDRPRWLIEPYIPVQGTVLLHGKFSLGKSPLVWRIAQCVSEGIDFFGLPVAVTGNVLYVEVDEPLMLTVERLKLLNPLPSKVTVVGINPFSVLQLQPEDSRVLRGLNESLHPKLVIVNTLRKCHHLIDTESTAPSQVYGAWRSLFPESCVLFVHHDKKSSTSFDGSTVEARDEDFSGSQAWANDAQVALHLIGSGDRKHRMVRLKMTKTQLSQLADPISMKLGEDGVNWIDTGTLKILKTFSALPPTLSKMEKYASVAVSCGVSERTVRRVVGMEGGVGEESLPPAQPTPTPSNPAPRGSPLDWIQKVAGGEA